jgi:hypothetical protein
MFGYKPTFRRLVLSQPSGSMWRVTKLMDIYVGGSAHLWNVGLFQQDYTAVITTVACFITSFPSFFTRLFRLQWELQCSKFDFYLKTSSRSLAMNLPIWPVLRNFLPASAATVHYRFPIFNSKAHTYNPNSALYYYGKTCYLNGDVCCSRAYKWRPGNNSGLTLKVEKSGIMRKVT